MKLVRLRFLSIAFLIVFTACIPNLLHASAGFTASSTNVTLNSSGMGVSTVTLSASTGYSGTVGIVCNFTSGPVPAESAPICVTTPPRAITLNSSQPMQTTPVPFYPPGSAVPAVESNRGAEPATPRKLPQLFLPASGFAFAALLLLGASRIRTSRRLYLGLCIVAGLAGAAAISACGGSSTSPPITAGSYTYTVTASDNAGNQASTVIHVSVPMQ